MPTELAATVTLEGTSLLKGRAHTGHEVQIDYIPPLGSDVVNGRLLGNLRIREPQEVFTRVSETFAIVRWNIKPIEEGFKAEVDFCPLSSQAKMIGAPSPCRHYCLDALAEAVQGLSPASSFKVCETLWEGDQCRVMVT